GCEHYRFHTQSRIPSRRWLALKPQRRSTGVAGQSASVAERRRSRNVGTIWQYDGSKRQLVLDRRFWITRCGQLAVTSGRRIGRFFADCVHGWLMSQRRDALG